MSDQIAAGELKRIRGLYRAKRKVGFPSFDQFLNWHQLQFKKQEGRCFYCQTHISTICQIIDRAFANGAVFHNFRKVSGGGIRGKSLEIERRDPSADYSANNCALVCYFCNNDKSSVYTESDYVKFFGPARRRHFEYLADSLGVVVL